MGSAINICVYCSPYLFLFAFDHTFFLVPELPVLCMKFCNAERNEGVDGESPQRCKARLERHQRTAERAV